MRRGRRSAARVAGRRWRCAGVRRRRPRCALGSRRAARVGSVGGTSRPTPPRSSPRISADGRYVAFQTARPQPLPGRRTPIRPGFRRQGGIFRRDLATGALELVACGDLVTASAGGRPVRGAQNPSISADGRYVAFSTARAARRRRTRTPNIDVYVRDMSVPIDDPAAFELVSALDGGDDAARLRDRPGRRDRTRSAGRGDQRGRAEGGVPHDRRLGPRRARARRRGNLFVRDSRARTTTLVTAGAATARPPAGRDGRCHQRRRHDGRLDRPDAAGADARSCPARRPDDVQELLPVAAGRGRPGRARAASPAASDPDDPGCPPDELPCATIRRRPAPATGRWLGGEDFIGGTHRACYAVPERGRLPVAFLTAGACGPDALRARQLDLFVTDMSAGVTRKAGTLELTRESRHRRGRELESRSSTSAMSADGQPARVHHRAVRFILPIPAPGRPRLVTVGP